MGQATILRKMSRKSVFDFGKHKDKSVQQLFDLLNIRYLRWIYFNMSGITFFDDILDQLKITEEYRIEKPGKNPEMYDYINNKLYKKMSLKRRGLFKQVMKKRSKMRMRNILNEAYLSKGKLQSLNHGHKMD